MSGIQSTQSSSPLLSPPITGGISASDENYLSGTIHGVESASTNSTSYVDVVNYTGAGVLEFCLGIVIGAGVTGSYIITIDGLDSTFTITSTSGAYSMSECFVGAVASYISDYVIRGISLASIPFKESLRIQHKTSNGSYTMTTNYRYRKTA